MLTDIATGWTECAPLIVREQTLLSTVLTELRKQLPFALLGLDTDNDTVFMNETLKAYCDAANIVFTRCRPYRKNDQAFVEQKNGAVVRRTVGYHRFEGLEASTLLAQLYRSMRLFVNFFQPSFKLIGKQRDGARAEDVRRASDWPPMRAHPTKFAPVFGKSTPVSIPSRCCVISAPHRNGSPRSPMLSQPPSLRRQRNQSIFSWRACERPGRRERYDRPIGRSSKPREAGAVPTRSFGRRRICENGSKPSPGGPAANSCRAWRNIRALIRISFFERFSVASSHGAASKRTPCCSPPREGRCRSTRSQCPGDWPRR